MDLALADYLEATRLDPNLAEAWLCRGIDFDERGEYEGAIRALTRAIEINPCDPDAYRCRALAYRKLGQHVEADRDEQRAEELGSHHPLQHSPA